MHGGSRSAGTSRGCRQCRAKRKKCDLQSPCGRCAASKILCSGPVTGNLLVNRYAKDFTMHSQRSVLKDALSERQYHGNAEQGFAELRHHKHIPTTFDVSLDRHTIRDLYACLLEDFHSTSFSPVGNHDSIFNRSAIMLCLKLVAGLGSATHVTPQHLDIGVFSLLSLYLGRKCPQHHRLVDLGRRSYSLTVQALYHTLSGLESASGAQNDKQQLQQSRRINAFHLSLILTLFELVDAPQAVAPLDMHIDGALHILRQIGPLGIADSTVQKELLQGFRSIAYASAVRRRLSLFLDEPEWLTAFSNGGQRDDLEQLYDIAVRLPRLLKRTNDLISPADKPLRMVNNSDLLLEYTALKSMLLNWYLQQTFRSDRYSTPGSKHSPKDSTPLQAKFENMPHLSTMLIELDMGFNDFLSSATQQHSNLGDVHRTYNEYEIIDTRELLSTMTESIESLRNSSEGQLVTAIPLDTLRRYQARELERCRAHDTGPHF